jgi:tetratricopeptide (TPR) repeat protein
MILELKVRFTTPDRIVVQYDDRETQSLVFVLPLSQGDRNDMRWYLETYGAAYTSEPDDLRAQAIEMKLLQWGTILFEAIFCDESALEQYRAFEATNTENKLLTIASNHPEILSLPWELLCDGRGAPFLLRDPAIGIQRCLDRNLDEIDKRIQPKQFLHMVYLTSRPEGTGFIDPRVEAIPVLEVLEREAFGVIDIEFLRPATLENLSDRLACNGNHQGKTHVDILHFDGHGSFNPVKNQGFLEFEDVGCKRDSVSAEKIGELLQKYSVGLMVLSACQSAQVAGEDPMGSVAVQLNAAGVPAVLAMSYSILAESARRLFGAFYRNLLAGQGVGASLNGARVALFRDRARGERQRWQRRIVLELQDWFLPALYQLGGDTSLLLPRETIDMPVSSEAAPKIPEFFGRAWELWDVERKFVQNKRRITISGFGGQGKTALAQEACQWLTRTRLFERAGFVSFAGFQNLETSDALRFAVASLGQELGESFLDEEAVRVYLQKTPTVIVLDNLETLRDEGLTELLDAAVGWSEAGDSRVLLTTRSTRLSHSGYPINERVHSHYAMRLDGWREEDAIAYFQQAFKSLSNSSIQFPTREDLAAIFRKVSFQPLAVRLLAESIKNQPCSELEQALDRLLAQEDSDDPNHNLKASLNLSLQRLEPVFQEWLPRLGVFQGGAWEPMVQQITEASETTWQQLIHELETVGLIQVKSLPSINAPYLKFHPMLASVLWERLDPATCKMLTIQHQEYYYALSDELYFKDRKNALSTRAIAQWELPNLLFAVRGMLEAASPDAADFVENVNMFLDCFGMGKDRDDLTARSTDLVGTVGSYSWYLVRSHATDKLYNAGSAYKAVALLKEILKELGETPSHERSLTFSRLGRCYQAIGELDKAETSHRKGLEVTETLITADPEDQDYQRQKGVLLEDLANVLMNSGRYGDARQAYEASLEIALDLGDNRDAAARNFELCTLALEDENLKEATDHYQGQIVTFKRLYDPQGTAIGYQQLGNAYSEAQQWEAAEHAHRRSAAIQESLGNLRVAADTWGQMAIAYECQGNFDAAEPWYRKALDTYRQSNDSIRIISGLNNLADFLQQQSRCLVEAQQLAEEALGIQQNIDPAATQIWKTYNILAEIAIQQGNTETSLSYRRKMRQSYNTFLGVQNHLQECADLIAGVVAATQKLKIRQQLEAEMQEVPPGCQNLFAAIHQLLNGERAEDTLCNSLDYDDSAIVCAILRDLGATSSLPAGAPLQPFLQTSNSQLLIEQLDQIPEGQALLQAIELDDDILFNIQTPLNYYIRVTITYWEVITRLKHPILSGKETEVQSTLCHPDEIRRSRSDRTVYLFYRLQAEHSWICAVAKQLGRDGLLITAYPTDAIKEGETVWQK